MNEDSRPSCESSLGHGKLFNSPGIDPPTILSAVLRASLGVTMSGDTWAIIVLHLVAVSKFAQLVLWYFSGIEQELHAAVGFSELLCGECKQAAFPQARFAAGFRRVPVAVGQRLESMARR